MVRALAGELDEKLRGARLRGLVFDSDARVHLVTATGTLSVDLHPQNGAFSWSEMKADTEHGIPLPGQARIRAVSAPADERVLVFEISGRHAGGSVQRLVIELVTNQWNAIAIRENERIARVLRARTGARRLEPRARYEPLPRTERAGAKHRLSLEAWARLLADVPPDGWQAFGIREIAWLSALNAGWVFDPALSPGQSHERYSALLNARGGAHYERNGEILPYVPALGAAVHTFDSLIDAIAALAAPQRTTVEQVNALIDRERRKLRRLNQEAKDAARSADALREQASLVLAYQSMIPRGASKAEVPNADGTPLEVALDPASSAVENANRMFAEARKRERADERLPAMIERVETRIGTLEQFAARAAAGEDISEEIRPFAAVARVRAAVGPKLPYRSYRTSGGLEVRVGRNARANDELTLRHTSPSDIWLHARDVGGAHVVLRWQDRVNNPPRSDLIEAAILAAIHSRSRTTSAAAVDWTRRKYVRKPRKAAPGAVVLERANTLFVKPDPALEKKLRADAQDAP